MVNEYRDAATALSLSLEPVLPPPSIKTRLMEAIAPPVQRSAPVFTRLFWAAAAVALFGMIFVSLRHTPGMRELTWNPTPVAPGAHGIMRCWGPSVVLAVSGLPQLPGGRVYQLWHIRSDKIVVDQATFTLQPSGELVGRDRIKQKIAAEDLFGITVEPAGGSRYPTMPIYTVAKY